MRFLILSILFILSVSLSAQDYKLHTLKGREKSYNGDYTGAIAEFNKAIEIEPTYYYPYLDRGKAKAELMDYRGAIADFNKAFEAASLMGLLDYAASSIYYHRGQSKIMLKDYRGAIIDLKKMIEIDINDMIAYHLIGICKYELNDINGACLDWSKAGELGLDEAYDMIKQFCN